MSFKEKYPCLFVLFGAYFLTGSTEGLNDSSVLEEYKQECDERFLLTTKAEMLDLMKNNAYWKDAANEANRYFPDNESLVEWLSMINYELG